MSNEFVVTLSTTPCPSPFAAADSPAKQEAAAATADDVTPKMLSTTKVYVRLYSINYKGTVNFTYTGEAVPPDLDPTLTPQYTSIYLDEDDDAQSPICFEIVIDGDPGSDVTITIVAQAAIGSASDSDIIEVTLP